MHPSRAASLLALFGAVLLMAALALRGFSLVQAAALGGLAEAPQPGMLASVGSYTPLDDGARIAFQQSLPNGLPHEAYWYSMPVSGGALIRADAPRPSYEPFLLHNRRAFVLVADGSGVLGGSPPGEVVTSAVLAPNRQMLAFATRTTNGRARLYVLYESTQLDWLGEETSYIDLEWSPTSDWLAFVSPRQGIDQIFTANLSGDTYRQLTFDAARKSSPRWSPDGGSIAYLANSGRGVRSSGPATPTPPPLVLTPTRTPAPGRSAIVLDHTDIFLMAADGSDQRALTDTPEQEYALAWLETSRGSELGFAVRQPAQPAVAYYYALNGGEAPRRVYPPVLLEGIQCPRSIPFDSRPVVRISLSNSGLVPLDLPLILRVRERPFALSEPLDSAAVRVETVTLLPGETRVLEWDAAAVPGRATYFSVIANLEHPYPLYEQHCAAPNTYLGLPSLPFLPLTIPLAVLGLALCLPRLFQRKSWLWWIFWLAGGLSLLGLTWLEMRL